MWQRDFYEHVIRCEAELMAIREYMSGNPSRGVRMETTRTIFRPHTCL